MTNDQWPPLRRALYDTHCLSKLQPALYKNKDWVRQTDIFLDPFKLYQGWGKWHIRTLQLTANACAQLKAFEVVLPIGLISQIGYKVQG